MNYIKHLNAVFEQFSKDSRLNPKHISLYVSLFQFWNYNRFPEEFYVNREDVMKFSKIGSKSTYHRCIKELDSWKYLMYNPSHNPFKGSRIRLFQFGTSAGQAVDLNRPISGQALVSVINMNKQITNFFKLEAIAKEKLILDFFKKENYPELETKKFFNHYQGIGWKVGGKTKMVDWQATARSWMLKAQEMKSNSFLPPVQNAVLSLSKGRDNLHTTKNKNYCFDDLGIEPTGCHYTKECNVMGEILLSRYDIYVNNGKPAMSLSKGSKTHITTNLNAEELETRYGSRVRSRLREMFNLRGFDEASIDKRK